jgi:hypothetical protein
LIEDDLIHSFVGVEWKFIGDKFSETGDQVELVLDNAGLLEFVEDEGDEAEGFCLIGDEDVVVDLDDPQQDLGGFDLELIIELRVVEDDFYSPGDLLDQVCSHVQG